jgi:hypothetical protein
MRRHLAVLAVAGLALVAAAPAPGASGAQRFDGVIVTSGASGTRTVLSSPVVGRGVLNAVGKLVEVDNLPGDPDDVSRDDLVFAGGSLHLVSVTNDSSFQLEPRSCTFVAKIQQTGTIAGGTGRFAHAAGTSTARVTAIGLLARLADGSCDPEHVPLVEVDTITSTGTLSF